MREEDKAARILDAVVKAVDLPVTLKMRTGWDDNSRNAPRLAQLAENAGIKMITVHGRTRCQFYNGKSDWDFIARIKQATSLPVIGNGDVLTLDDVNRDHAAVGPPTVSWSGAERTVSPGSCAR